MTDQQRSDGAEETPPTEEGELDRVLAYIARQEQKEAQRSWTDRVGRWSAYIALAAFFFGFGSVADLVHHSTGEASLEKIEIKDADSRCRQVWHEHPVPYQALDTSEINDIYRTLLFFAAAVHGVQEHPDLFRHLSAAADFWAATAIDVKKRDEAGYQRDIGSYEAALGSYQHEAIQLGFKPTNFCTLDTKLQFPLPYWPPPS
jgi:hypothetical protein